MLLDLLNDPEVKVGDSEEGIALMKVWRGKIFIGSRQSSNSSFASETRSKSFRNIQRWEPFGPKPRTRQAASNERTPKIVLSLVPSETPSFCRIRASELCRALYAMANFSKTKQFCN